MDEEAALERGEAIIAALAENERRIAALQAEQVQLLAALANIMPKKPSEPYGEFVPDQIAVALSWSSNTAARRLHHAVELTTRLPQLLEALHAGELDLWRTEIVFDAVRKLPDHIATQVCDHALTTGLDRPAGLLKRLVRKAVLTYDPDGQQKRHREARDDRRVSFQPLDDGMAELAAYLPAHEAVLIDRRLDAFAHHPAPDDGRTMDQRRADAFRDLMLNPAMGPIITKVHLTVPADTITGTGTQPGELTRYGSLDTTQTRELALGYTNLDEPGYGRKLAADPTWRRLLTDPTSNQLLDYGTRTYKPPATLAGYVRARDPHCIFPGCSRSSDACDLDHRIPYPQGPTNADNLAPLCRHHHRLKHDGGWTLLKHGTHYTWLTPTQTAARHPHTPTNQATHTTPSTTSGPNHNTGRSARTPTNQPTTPTTGNTPTDQTIQTTPSTTSGPNHNTGRSPHTPTNRPATPATRNAPAGRTIATVPGPSSGSDPTTGRMPTNQPTSTTPVIDHAPTNRTTQTTPSGPNDTTGRSPRTPSDRPASTTAAAGSFHAPVDRATGNAAGHGDRRPTNRTGRAAAERGPGLRAASSGATPAPRATPNPPGNGPRAGKRRSATYRSRKAYLAALRRALVIDGPPSNDGGDPPPF